MSFVDPGYPLFLLGVLAVWTMLQPAGRRLMIVASGLMFYGWVDPRLVLLLVASAFLDFFVAQRIEDDPDRARAWTLLSVFGNLGVLGGFKAADFFVREIGGAASAIGLGVDPVVVGALVPPGLSFYTLQTLGYTLDVRAGRVRAERDANTFLAFVAFFPQLIVGPIERAADLLPQVRAPRAPTREDLVAGMDLLLWGAVQKLAVADVLAPWVDRCFSQPATALTLAAGTLGFMVQLLADFRGYTHLARGSARLLGIRLTPNFDRPYLARSPSDFWQRWHATLTRWMMDHGFAAMGGLRRPVLATLGTMALVGLWHGLAGTFLAFGLLHGVALVVWRPLRARWPALDRPLVGWLAWTPVLLLSLAVFRAPDLPWFASLTMPGAWDTPPDLRALASATLALAAAAGGAMALGTALAQRLPPAAPWVAPLRLVAWTLALLAVLTFGGGGGEAFVYWRF